VTLIDHPHRMRHHNTALFDHEGVPTQVFPLFERGVFTGFISDLRHAKKLGRRSTGHGYKATMWGGGIGTPVQPSLQHLMFQPGDTPHGEMVESMDEGIILHFPNSPHSGNIPQGDFSVNIGLGYYVKDGKVVGRVEDCMVSGNIYKLFSNLDAVSAELDDDGIPHLLFRNVSVAGSA
jgi:PmbA protein